MAGPYNAGTIYLQVVPSYRNFQESIRKAARHADKIFQEEFGKGGGAGEAVERALSSPQVIRVVQKSGQQAGAAYGDKFEVQVQRHLAEAFKSIPEPQIKLRTNEAEREVARLREKLRGLSDVEILAHMSPGQVIRELAVIQAELNKVAGKRHNIEVTAGISRAVAELRAVGKVADQMARDKRIGIDVDGAGPAIAQLLAVSHAADRAQGSADGGANAFRAINGRLLAFVLLAPMAIPLFAGIAAAVAGIIPMLLGAGAALGVFILALSGIPGAVKAMGDAQENAAKDAEASAKRIRTAAESVKDAERSLANARQNAARAQADAARQVADAERRLTDARRDAAEAQKAAARKVADARENLARVEQEVAKDIADAQRDVMKAIAAVTEAREEGARDIERAIERQIRAEEDLADAQRAATKAQEDLMEARREAQRDIDDLHSKGRDLALDERDALLDLAFTQGQIDAALAEGRPVSERMIYERDRDIEDLAEIRRQIALTKEDQAAAVAAGVEGSERVRNAQERLLDATNAQAQAQRDLAAAEAEVARTRVEDLRRIEAAQQDVTDAQAAQREAEVEGALARQEAQEALTDAIAAQGRTAQDSARNIREAQRGVADAMRSSARSAQDSSEAIESAQRNLTMAQLAYRDAVNETSTSQQKLNEEMAKLSPAGAAFATYINSLRPFFALLRGAAESGLLPGLMAFMKSMIDAYGPGFIKFIGDMSRVLGGLFAEAGRVFKSPAWREFFGMVAEFGPVFARQFGEVFLNLMTAFASIMTAIAPFAKSFGDMLVRVTGRFAEWVSGLSQMEGFRSLMAYLDKIGPKVWAFIEAFVGALINLAVGLAPYAEMLLGIATGFFGFLADMDPQALGYIAIAIIAAVVAFQGLVGIMALANTIMSITTFAAWGLVGALAAWVLGIVVVVAVLAVLWQHSETFREIVGGAFDAVGAVATWLWEKVLAPFLTWLGKHFRHIGNELVEIYDETLGPMFAEMGRIVGWLWRTILRPIFKNISSGWDDMVRAIQATWNNVLYPILDIVGSTFLFLGRHIIRGVFIFISQIWTEFYELVRYGWVEVLQPTFKAIGDAWREVGAFFRSAWKDHIHPVLTALAKLFGGDAGSVDRAVQKGIERIKSMWEDMKEVFKAPIRFFIVTVLNNGLIHGFNKVADFFKAKNIPDIPLPSALKAEGFSGYAEGGMIKGQYRGPRADNVLIRANPREFVQQVAAVDYYGPGFMAALNERRIPKEILPGYATGGLIQGGGYQMVRPVKAGYGLPYGNTYKDGSFHSGQDFPAPAGTKVVAAMAGIVKAVRDLGNYSYGRHVILAHGGTETLYAHLSRMVVNMGEIVKAGQLIGGVGSTGNSTGNHLHFELRPGGGYNNAVDPRPYLAGARIPEDDGSLLGILPDWMKENPFSWLTDRVSGAMKGMTDSPIGRLMGVMPGFLLKSARDLLGDMTGQFMGAAVDLGKGVLDKGGDFIGNLTPWGGHEAVEYDQGGYLPPGVTQVVNNTGRPEPVFNPEQWEALRNTGQSATQEMLERMQNDLLRRIADATEGTRNVLGRPVPTPIFVDV